MTVTISTASYLCDDIEALSSFYARVFEFPELTDFRSDIFVGLEVDGVMLGFSSKAAYELLQIEAWADAKGTKQYLTFEAPTDDEVTSLAAAAVDHGATVLHEPYETYYGAYQVVLSDPEGNVFRINNYRA